MLVILYLSWLARGHEDGCLVAAGLAANRVFSQRGVEIGPDNLLLGSCSSTAKSTQRKHG
jgi:hypothetical protein